MQKEKLELAKRYYFPFPFPGFSDEDGLLCQGGSLAPDLLIFAYSRGIFPWFNPGDPILWWCPDPRWILYPDKFHLSRRSMRKLNKFPFILSRNHAFKETINNCADIRSDHTWITDEMKMAYITLHELGFAHSFEAWKNGKLVGGLYGVAIGKAFFGESMFHLENDASKAALWALVNNLRKENFSFIDCQQESEHMQRAGSEAIPRSHFLLLLMKNVYNGDMKLIFTNKSSLKGKAFYDPELDIWANV